MFKREKSSALKSMMSKSAGGSKFAEGRKAMRERQAQREEELAEDMQHALDQFTGTIETMFLAAAADGTVTRDEINHMADVVYDITDGELRRDDVVQMILDFSAAMEQDGYEGRLEALADGLDDDVKRSAFTLAAAIAMGDGELDEGEEELFYDLAETYDIDDDEAESIMEGVAEALSE